jgi:hypothetical protein
MDAKRQHVFDLIKSLISLIYCLLYTSFNSDWNKNKENYLFVFSTICLALFVVVGTRLHLQILKFLLFVNANQNEYLFGICPRSKTSIKKMVFVHAYPLPLVFSI